MSSPKSLSFLKHLTFFNSLKRSKNQFIFKRSDLLKETSTIVLNGDVKHPNLKKNKEDKNSKVSIQNFKGINSFAPNLKQRKSNYLSDSSFSQEDSDNEEDIELGESFLLYIKPGRIQHLYIFVQVHTCFL